jgi:hypothetical protein
MWYSQLTGASSFAPGAFIDQDTPLAGLLGITRPYWSPAAADPVRHPPAPFSVRPVQPSRGGGYLPGVINLGFRVGGSRSLAQLTGCSRVSCRGSCQASESADPSLLCDGASPGTQTRDTSPGVLYERVS